MFVDKWYVVTYSNNNTSENKIMMTEQSYSKKSLLFIAFSLLFCFSAFRFNIGWDYWAYYDTIKYNLFTNIVSSEEYATISLIELSRFLNMTNLYFVVNSFICIFFIYKTISKYSIDPWLSLLLFLCFPLFFLNSLSIIRFFTALALTFYGFKFIVQKQLIKYIILVLLASLFHKSAIIALAFYFVRYMKLGTVKIAIILVSLPFIGTFLNSFVLKYLPKYAIYTETSNIQEGTKAIFFFLIVAFLALLLRKKITLQDEIATMYFNLFFIGIAIYLMFYAQGTMGHRLSLYGTIYVLLVVPKMFSIFKRGLDRTFLKYLFYLLLIVAFLYTVNVGFTTYIPYRTIFD